MYLLRSKREHLINHSSKMEMLAKTFLSLYHFSPLMRWKGNQIILINKELLIIDINDYLPLQLFWTVSLWALSRSVWIQNIQPASNDTFYIIMSICDHYLIDLKANLIKSSWSKQRDCTACLRESWNKLNKPFLVANSSRAVTLKLIK